jgi:large subunit ribosomal protein L3
MINTIFGTKEDMTAIFKDSGKRLAATRLKLPELRLIRLTNPEKEGYSAVQLAIGRKTKVANKPLTGHLKTAKLDYQPRYIREVRSGDIEGLSVGEELDVSTILSTGDLIAVTATTKGKGFSGVVKRHGFAGGPKTHGQSDRHRAPGSIGQGTTPGRVFKGKKMAGRMGGDTVTVKNLKVIEFDPATRMILVSGPVPGHRGSLVKIQILKKMDKPAVEAEATAPEESIEN